MCSKKSKVVITVSFPVSDSVYAQLKAIADDREWTVAHVLRKVVPLGLDVYLKQITLPPLYPDLSDTLMEDPTDE